MALSKQYINYALETKSKYPAVMVSVMLGQFIEESGAGTSHRAKVSNNCFGIGGRGDRGTYNGMAAYSSKKESFLAYGRLMSKSLYTRHTKGATSPRAYLRGLQEVPYCADPAGDAYINKIMAHINSYNLTQYDKKASKAVKSVSSKVTTTNTKDIVDIALAEVGYKEKPTNITKYGAKLGHQGQAWCHSFVSWCALQAGQASHVPQTASTSDGMKWFKDRGLFRLKGKYTPKRGDIVYFKTHRSHVGIVRYAKNGMLYTVEGNSSNAVKTRTYSLNNGTITGYGVPSYSYINADDSSSISSTSSTSANSKKEEEEKKEQAKQEIAYLKKILNRHATVDTSINGKVVNTYKIPKCNVLVIAHHNGKYYSIPIEDDMKLTEERIGSASELEFSTPSHIKLTEGDAVAFKLDNHKMFYGFIFTISRTKSRSISYTCYDQLRYLKNKDTVVYNNFTLTKVIKYIARRNGLQVGTLAKTKYKMSKVEDDSELLDIIDDAISETATMENNLYIFYDSYGKLTLKNIKDMKVNSCVIDDETGEDYTYKTSIDDNVYNQIKLIYENAKTGTYDMYIARSSKNISKWGLLQYLEKIDYPTVGKLKSQAYLRLYNQKVRTLSVSGIVGNPYVRGGSLVPVMLTLSDIKICNYMLVDKVVHHFKNHRHTMDLDLTGDGFTSDSNS